MSKEDFFLGNLRQVKPEQSRDCCFANTSLVIDDTHGTRVLCVNEGRYAQPVELFCNLVHCGYQVAYADYDGPCRKSGLGIILPR